MLLGGGDGDAGSVQPTARPSRRAGAKESADPVCTLVWFAPTVLHVDVAVWDERAISVEAAAVPVVCALTKECCDMIDASGVASTDYALTVVHFGASVLVPSALPTRAALAGKTVSAVNAGVGPVVGPTLVRENTSLDGALVHVCTRPINGVELPAVCTALAPVVVHGIFTGF